MKQTTVTSEGPPQIKNLNPYDTIQAETICSESGIETEVCSEGGIDVGNIENGDYIKVKGVDFGAGAVSFDARVASNTSGGKIELRLDSQTGSLVGTCDVQGTGGWQNWETGNCTVSGATGKHDLYLKFTGGSDFLFNVNWWKFNSLETGITPEKSIKVEKIRMAIEAGKLKSIRLTFPQPVQNQNISVCMFDLKGRMVKTLYTGRITTPDLFFPLNREMIQPGCYVISVTLNNRSVFKNKVIL